MRSEEALVSFVRYCYEHPEQRFWQALRNWSKYTYIFGYNGMELDKRDRECFDIEGMVNTFHLEGLDGTR